MPLPSQPCHAGHLPAPELLAGLTSSCGCETAARLASRPAQARSEARSAAPSPASPARRHWLLAQARQLLAWGGGLALACGPAGLLAGPRALSVPLAMDADDTLHPAGWLVSEKFDGVRAVWDGQQLRFRSGLPVAAPAWFTQRLPAVPLDGELWLDRGQFEALSGLVRRQVPDEAGWRRLRYLVFELPAGPARFDQRCQALQALVRQADWPALQAVAQHTVPDIPALQQRLQSVLQAGGEGLMLCRADAPYAAGRTPALRKLKPQQDAEAVVLGHVPGRGKHAGRLGALRVQEPGGPVFHIGTGFSDAQRAAPPAPGQRITFRYRGRTEAGLPRFASYLRERPEGL